MWMTHEALGAEWEPSRSKMMIYSQGPQTTVLVAPERPDAWKQEPYHLQLRILANKVEAESGYLIVFVGDDVTKVEPEVLGQTY
ncbi:hypothetical protein [Sinorhizobium sp. BG8]|uniref:hypothetical protein n=1 Tax=Sinorhizobium sp. BG8 TaxID=2613773 RepID=UPI001FEFB7FF|nr:hypothetical protein [Sinorhizobium sp. BG8]